MSAKHHLHRMMFLGALAALTSCADISTFLSGPEEESPPAPAPLSDIALYITRAHRRGVAFEQYRSIGERLYFECGRIELGEHTIEQRGVNTIDDERREQLEETALEIATLLNRGDAYFESPGDNSRVRDPGKLTLSFSRAGKTTRIESSQESVAIALHAHEEATKQFVELLRAVPPSPPCGYVDFFGLSLS